MRKVAHYFFCAQSPSVDFEHDQEAKINFSLLAKGWHIRVPRAPVGAQSATTDSLEHADLPLRALSRALLSVHTRWRSFLARL